MCWKKRFIVRFYAWKKWSHNFFGFSCHILQLNLAINEFFLQSSLGIYFSFLRNLLFFLIPRPVCLQWAGSGSQFRRTVPGARGCQGVVAGALPTWLRCLGHLPPGREEEASAAWWMPDCRRLGLGGFCLFWTENLGCFSLHAEFICGGYLL